MSFSDNKPGACSLSLDKGKGMTTYLWSSMSQHGMLDSILVNVIFYAGVNKGHVLI